MTTETTAIELAPMLTALIPVAAGGLIALAGVIGGGFLTHWLKSKADNETRKKDKYEELLETLFHHKHWLEKMKDHRVFAAEKPSSKSPISRIRAITSLYFSELKELVTKLDTASDEYELWMLDASKERISNRVHSEESLSEGAEKYKSYAEIFYKLINLMEQNANNR